MTDVGKGVKCNKNNTCCSVYKCRSVGKKHPDVRFHVFPKPGASFVEIVNESGEVEKIDRLKAWEMAAQTRKKVSRYMKVCSLHFRRDDYILPDYHLKKMCLKKTAVPSCNLPDSSVLSENGKQTKVNNYLRPEKKLKTNVKEGQYKQQEVNANHIPTEQIIIAEVKTEVVQDYECMSPHRDIGVQVKSGDSTLRFVHFIKGDNELTTTTGLPSFDILRSLVKVVTLVFPSDNNAEISIEDKVIMTYVKLKQNVSYAFLAVMFNVCTEGHCRQIFYEMVRILSQALRVAVRWPSRDEMSRNLPSCFENFKDVVVALDCTEVFIEGSKKFCCQLHTFSHEKGSNTCKILTGVTPAGHISFISKAYGGRASDKAIFQQSDLVNLLQPGDAVMVDHGLQIDDICKMNGWRCIRPPSLKNKEQLSGAEVALTSKITCARVHIERSNQRFKAFGILGDGLPIELVPLIEDIFSVICATVNLTSPVLMDDKEIHL